jgi:hypothetical protein
VIDDIRVAEIDLAAVIGFDPSLVVDEVALEFDFRALAVGRDRAGEAVPAP